MEKLRLDATDIRILSAVQKHGQLSKTKLAEIVNLSPTPCWARLTKLKAAGFIRGYHADITLERICDFTQVIVTISLTQHRKSDFDRFEAHVRNLDEVTECIATGGGMDYVLKIFAPNLTAFQKLMESLLAAELGIDPFDPAQAIPAAALYLTQIRAYLIGRLGRWSWPLVLSGYNWGMGNTANAAEQHGDGWMAHVPEETRDYVRRVGPAFGDRGALVLVVAAVAVAAMWVLA